MKEVQLQRRTRLELLALAGKAKVRGRHRMTKGQLMRAIRSRAATASRSRRRRRSELSETEAAHRVTAAVSPPLVKEEQRGLKELTELPSSYGQTRLTLMPVDPYHIHAYWEVTPHDRETTMTRLGPEGTEARWVLRFYDVTYIDFDGTNAHGYFDQPIDLIAGNWYVELWSSDKTYCADIGALAPSGRFRSACRSNFVQVPRAGESPHYWPEWLHVEGVFDKLERVTLSPPSESPGTAAEFPVAAETAPLVMPERERTPHTPVAETDIRRHFGGLLSPGRAAGANQTAAGNQVNPAPGVPQDASGETPPGTAWHEVRGRFSPPLGSLGGSSWAPTGQTAVDLKSGVEDGVVPRSPSLETAPEKTAPPQDERGMIGAKQLTAHPQEAAPEQARSFRAVSKGSQRPSRRVRAEPSQSSARPGAPVRK
jgi:hypothetical protein